MPLHPDLLFLATCVDLERRLAIGSDYSRMQAAASLRLLLLDGTPLLLRVNRSYRFKLLFHIGHPVSRSSEPRSRPPEIETLGDGLDGRVAKSLGDALGRTLDEHVKLERFLAHPVIHVKTTPYSVRDVIKHVAHINGVVHAGAAETPEERTLEALRHWRLSPIGDPALLQIRSIGQVTLNACRPLFDHIRAGFA